MLFIFLCLFLSVFSICNLLFVHVKNEKVGDEEVKSISIWHIDGFEGGKGSRLSLLKKISSEFCKDKSIIVTVKLHTIYSAESNFEKGIYPDLISYSNGLDIPYSKLVEINNECYLKCWAMGGYLYITRKGVREERIIVSQQKYTLPIVAMRLEGISLPIKKILSSENAYYEFLADKECSLIGTQRDLFRLKNKNIEVNYKPLEKFNDLKQYISILSDDGGNKNIALLRKFVDFLLEKVQAGYLKEIGLMNETGYSVQNCDETLQIYEGIRFEYTTKELSTKLQIKELQEYALKSDSQIESIKSSLKRLK